MDISERLALFYRRLEAAPPAATAARAFALICRTLDEVEDEFCPVPKKHPPPRRFEGRMSIPQADRVMPQADGSWWVETRRHRISVKPDGGFVIFRIFEDERLVEEFRKAGGRQ